MFLEVKELKYYSLKILSVIDKKIKIYLQIKFFKIQTILLLLFF